MEQLTNEQVKAVEGMIQRRMDNTDETRQEACNHILNYLTSKIEDDAT